MTTTDGRTRLDHIEPDECLRLLAAGVIGRLAIVSAGTPRVFPVNYVLDGEDIVFRTDPGTKLDLGPRAPACFEIDEIDPATEGGWSVVVTGRLEEVTKYDPKTWSRVRRLRVHPWAGGPKGHWMRLVPSSITGRRIRPRVRTRQVVL